MYGLKYELLCTTRKGNLYTVKVLFDGYMGNQIDRNVPISPFKLHKDRAVVIKGTSFEFSIREEVDFEFMEFYTNNSRKVKVELYDPSDTLIWVGFNLPQQYQVPYTPAPTNVTFMATDGLGMLKNETFTLTGLSSQLTIVRHCIDKIGLSLGYSIAINLFAELHDVSRSPLAQTYEDTEIYEGLNCYEVLELVLIKYNAEITQIRGRWAITRNADKKSTRLLYTSAGVYETTEEAPAILNLGQLGNSGTDVYPRGSPNLSLQPGAKEVVIRHDYGRKNSFLENSEFSKFAEGQFVNWEKTGDFTLEQRFDNNGVSYAFLEGYSNVFTDHIEQVIPIVNEPGQDFMFEICLSPIGRFNYGNGHIEAIRMSVHLLIYLDTGTGFYYLKKDGSNASWTTTLTYIQHDIIMASMSEIIWNNLKFITNEIPGSGDLHVRLHRHHPTYTINPGDEFIGTAFTSVWINFLKNGELPPSGIETRAVFDNSTEPGKLADIEIKAGDAPPDVLNNSILYKNVTRYSDGTLT